MKIDFSRRARELLVKSGADASKISQKTLEKLDQNHDGSIAETELRALDFNQDERISPFEIRDFEFNERALIFPSPASGKSSASTEAQKPEALPDVSYEGPPIVEVNNPEKISQPGLVFNSADQQPPVNLGVDPRDFNYLIPRPVLRP